MQKKNTVVSGIQPTGELHIGNYLGMLSHSLKLQNEYTCYFFIVDLHSLTNTFAQNVKRAQIVEVAVDLLALGFDPNKCTLFIQSHIREHTELTWIFNCLTSFSELQRMTQFKDKAENDPKNVNVGLFDYPILQAADILMYKPYGVPVGKDQAQHIELTRTIAKIFNKRFGNTFPSVKPLFTDTPVIKSLTYPDKKMSKSHGKKSYIALHDDPNTIRKKLAKAVTGKDSQSAGAKNLLLLLKQFAPEEYARFSSMEEISFKKLKESLGIAITDHFMHYRKRKKELQKNPNEVLSIFHRGADKARIVAKETMGEVKEKIGLI